jgi:hypothetical protein
MREIRPLASPMASLNVEKEVQHRRCLCSNLSGQRRASLRLSSCAPAEQRVLPPLKHFRGMAAGWKRERRDSDRHNHNWHYHDSGQYTDAEVVNRCGIVLRWMVSRNQPNRSQLGTELESAGWIVSNTTGEMATTGFGLNQQTLIRKAIVQAIKAAKLWAFNCLEITEVKRKSLPECLS